MKKIVVVDYGMGNLFSIQRAIQAIGNEPIVSSDHPDIINADYLILPGVGAFEKAMLELEQRNISQSIQEFASKGRPLLGICLGMQLLFTESFEFGQHKGLDLIKGQVVRFHKSEADKDDFKIPQIGWNSIQISSKHKSAHHILWDNTILDGIFDKSFFYFVHSFICVPVNIDHVLSETEYGKDRFCSVAHKDNIWGCQFHPERSGPKGLQIYRNFFTLL